MKNRSKKQKNPSESPALTGRKEIFKRGGGNPQNGETVLGRRKKTKLWKKNKRVEMLVNATVRSPETEVVASGY